MARIFKQLKKIFRRLLRHPWGKWVLLGGAATAVLAVAIVLLLSGREPEVPPIGSGGNTTSITLVAGGDLNVTDNTVAAGEYNGIYDYTAAFLDVAEIFAQADAAVVNLEGNLGISPYGSATTSAPLALAQALAACGVDFVQMANSCAVNNGLLGLSQTLSAIRSCGMEPLGAYESNAAFAKEQGFVLRNIGGIRVALVAFTKGMDGMGLPAGSEKCVNLLYTDYTTTYQKVNTTGITQILEAVNEAQPDITIALVHWGSEGNSTISPTQKKIVKLMQSLGVDAIIGTHSHQVQSVVYDEEKHTLVAYSLGDFFGDGTISGSRYSILLQLQITKDLDTGAAAITGWDYVPLYTLAPQQEGDRMQLLRIDQAMTLYENNHIASVSDAVYESLKSALSQIEKRIQPPAE